MNIFRTLFAPLKYLRAKNRLKVVWDWYIPILASAAITLLVLFVPASVPIVRDKGLIYWVNELLQVLVGFYIAALAAVASFDRPSLDQLIEGEGVSLNIHSGGESHVKKLTRRRFVSLMLGYLSVLAIFLYCLGVGVNLFLAGISLIPRPTLDCLRAVFVFLYIFLFSQMLCITLIVIYYLSDRMHRQTPAPLPSEDK